jgi:pimeloyl-ACP methyl ester carboxylesterase
MSAGYIVLIILGSLLFLYWAGGLAIAIILFFHGRRTDDQIIEYEVAEKGFDIKLLDIPCKRFYIHSRFGYRLHARLYEAKKPTNKYIIDIHGRSSSSISQLKYLKIFSDLGYNVLFPDQRGSGESGFAFYSFGVYEKNDIMSWISRIKRISPDSEIILFGESMGGATATMVAAADDRVKALVSYCSFSSIMDILKDHIGTPGYPKLIKYFIPSFIAVSLLSFGVRVWQADIRKHMRNISIPTLIIHSYGDKLVPIRQAKKLIEANPQAEYILFEDDEHARSLPARPREFTKVVQNFLKKIDS